MRLLIVAAFLGLAACTEAASTPIDAQTFKIEGPGLPSDSDAANHRVAARRCPNGYRIIDRTATRNTPDGYRQESGVFEIWTVRCL